MFHYSHVTYPMPGQSDTKSDPSAAYAFGQETAPTIGDTQMLIERFLHKELVARGLDIVTGPDRQTYSVSVFVTLLPPLPYATSR